MIHPIRTGFEESTMSYGGDSIPDRYQHYLQGLNQGNGAGPTLWSVLSSVNFWNTLWSGIWNRVLWSRFKGNLTFSQFFICGWLWPCGCRQDSSTHISNNERHFEGMGGASGNNREIFSPQQLMVLSGLCLLETREMPMHWPNRCNFSTARNLD